MAIMKYWDAATSSWKRVIGSVGQADGNIVELLRHDVTGTEAYIDLTDIPQGFDDLQIDLFLVTNRASNAGVDRLDVQLGGGTLDTGDNYTWRFEQVGGATDLYTHETQEKAWSGDIVARNRYRAGSVIACQVTGQTDDASAYGRMIIRRYTDTNNWRTIYAEGGGSRPMYSVPNDTGWISRSIGNWRNKTVPVQRMRLTPASGASFISGFVIVTGIKAGPYNA